MYAVSKYQVIPQTLLDKRRNFGTVSKYQGMILLLAKLACLTFSEFKHKRGGINFVIRKTPKSKHSKEFEQNYQN